MTSLSIEEENYVRMGLLITGVSPRAARALFDTEFHPSRLDGSLKKEYNMLFDMKKKRVINQNQWNMLFPRFNSKYKGTQLLYHDIIQHQWNIIIITPSVC